MEENTNTEYAQQSPTPNPDFKSLDKLVGMWQVYGPDIDGHVTFERMEGSFS